jgi:coatomer subunit beta
MEEAMKTILGSIFFLLINFVIKLLFLFWEVIEKTQANGKIREEFILVCNSLRKDLIHPNEYVRGRTLRLLTKLPYVGK